MNDDIIIHPRKTSRDRTIPDQGLLFVNPVEAKAALTTVLEQDGRRGFLHNSQLAVSADRKLFIAGPAIGAPSAVLAMEKLIVLGARSIILMGWCGAVDKAYAIGDIVVPTGAVCGEGTSRYYSDETQPSPSETAIVQVQKLLAKAKLPYLEGRIWSTDAPYRESSSYLQRLNIEEQVVGVDMEFSALCTVAAFRKIDFGAVLIVSDELWSSKWQPGFNNAHFQSRCRQVQQCLLKQQDSK
jgi:uridine phosphorylase